MNNQTKNQTKTLQGIQRYYTRTVKGEFGNTYYIEPRETCPLYVLNSDDRFVVVSFDKDDNYIVVDDKRYYLNKYNSIKATDKIQQRVAVVDLDELQKSKAYPYSDRFSHRFTSSFESFDELRHLAMKQYETNGIPFVKQLAQYDEKTATCSYIYEPSFAQATDPVTAA
ncbi:hypothetical protein HF865_03685 [Lactobacillus reuteri]|uniref:Uncharacterized protein n=1 Tax=Limosilactobacillus reuteri TaxID=1598 RepID=A0AAW9ZJE7_LIMRT|nr:hypothetical protein [Limosilactobacillus reuteri]NME21813.1 hypothetical protein [Limosilactobacillus reuteri]